MPSQPPKPKSSLTLPPQPLSETSRGPESSSSLLRVTRGKPRGLQCPLQTLLGLTRGDRVWRESGLQRNRAP